MNFHATYSSAIDRARHPLGAKIGNNTRIRREGKDLRVRLHNTDIVDVKPDNSLVLNMSGWNTVTTRERINQFTERNGVRLFSERGIAYLCPQGHWDQKVPYKDGARIYPGGRITGAGKPNLAAKQEKQRTRVRKYAAAYVKALAAGKVPAPGPGDCFFCQMRDTNTGRPIHQADHILSHMKERYFVPSLIVNATDKRAFPQASVSQIMLWALANYWGQLPASPEVKATYESCFGRPFVLNDLRKALVKWIEFNLNVKVEGLQCISAKPVMSR